MATLSALAEPSVAVPAFVLEKRPLPDRFPCDRCRVPVNDNNPKGPNTVTATTTPATLDAERGDLLGRSRPRAPH